MRPIWTIVRAYSDHGEVEMACTSEEEAFQYCKEHEDTLQGNEEFHIYYAELLDN